MSNLVINQNLSPSLKEALAATGEAIHRQRTILGILEKELAEQDEKVEIAKGLNLSLQGFRSYRTRLAHKINETRKSILAYQAGYLEIPDFGDAPELDQEQKGWSWRINLPGSVPLRVLRAVKQAEEGGFFKKLVVVQRGGSPDPIIVGIVGGIHFYITSYK